MFFTQGRQLLFRTLVNSMKEPISIGSKFRRRINAAILADRFCFLGRPGYKWVDLLVKRNNFQTVTESRKNIE